MIVVEKVSGLVHSMAEGADIPAFLASKGLDTSDVHQYTVAEYLATPEGTARKAEKDANSAAETANNTALDKVRARLPELASDQSMAVVYALWPALDEGLLPNALKLAVSEWAVAKGLPDRTGA